MVRLTASWSVRIRPTRVCSDPAPVDIERPRPVLQHRLGDRPGQRLPGNHYRFVGGLEGGAPALPLLGLGGGGGGEEQVCRRIAPFKMNRRAPAALSGLLSCQWVRSDNLTYRPARPVTVGALLLVVFIGRFGNESSRSFTPFARAGPVNRLRHVQRLREPRPVQPRNRVPDLEPRVLDTGRHSVICPGAAASEEMTPRLQHPQALRRPLLAPRLIRLHRSQPQVVLACVHRPAALRMGGVCPSLSGRPSRPSCGRHQHRPSPCP